MTTRAATLRSLFAPHLAVFAPDHRAALDELLELATVGERALTLFGAPIASRAVSKSQPTPKSSRGRGRPRKTPPLKDVAPRRKKADGSPSLGDVIRAALKESGKPLTLAELEAAVKAKGHTSSSGNFSKVLALTVSKMKSDLKRVSRGVYSLA